MKSGPNNKRAPTIRLSTIHPQQQTHSPPNEQKQARKIECLEMRAQGLALVWVKVEENEEEGAGEAAYWPVSVHLSVSMFEDG